MNNFHINWRAAFAAFLTSSFLVACGGGSDEVVKSPAAPSVPTVPTAPTAAELKIATDGFNWINFRRGQLGVPSLLKNGLVTNAAQGHSFYQKINDTVTHDQTSGKTGFTGTKLNDRLLAAGYVFNPNDNYAYGEVISATSSSSGEHMAEILVTAIYHRFVMFEPIFKEIGTGAATTSAGYSYFTADLTANNNYGPGVGSGNVVVWPFSEQTGVAPNFFSNEEAPDPVPNVNEVGYPISVHGDITSTLAVQTFAVRERGGAANLAVRLLAPAGDVETPKSAAAIIPLTPLKAGTTYDVTFAGTTNGVPVAKSWSFTTK